MCVCVCQGSASVGVKSTTSVVMVALKRSSSELSAHQKKIYHIDDHVGVAISGLTSDARMLRYGSGHSRFSPFTCKLMALFSVPFYGLGLWKW